MKLSHTTGIPVSLDPISVHVKLELFCSAIHDFMLTWNFDFEK